MNVINSEYPYVAAPIQLIPEGRDGLNTVHVYTRRDILKELVSGLFVAGDFAYQWNMGLICKRPLGMVKSVDRVEEHLGTDAGLWLSIF